MKFHQRVEAELDRVCVKYRVPRADVLGDKRRRTKAAVKARHSLLKALVDPKALDLIGQCVFRWSASEVARKCGVHHTVVLYAIGRTKQAVRNIGPHAEHPATVRERRARMRQAARKRAEAVARRNAEVEMRV